MSTFTGLTSTQVRDRIQQGQVNGGNQLTSRTYGEIIRSNVFTLFNGILATLLVLILVFGSVKDALFGVVLVFNALIGIVQEIRAKRTLDRLALASTPSAQVVRSGKIELISIEHLVRDDIVELRPGDQLAVDGTILSSEGVEIDESFLTGESVPVTKKAGDQVLSGSFVVAGSGFFQTTKVGNQTYARQLTNEARKFSLTRSELMVGINTFLRYVIFAMLVVTPILLITQLRISDSIYVAFPSTIAGLVGMVPQGLILLTSLAFAVSVIYLGRHQVLVQELSAVEGLARVDIVCFDKTGTLTTGQLVLLEIKKINQAVNIESILAAWGDEHSPNTTLQALGLVFPRHGESVAESVVPFSSGRKWSAMRLDQQHTWILGAPEIILEHDPAEAKLLSQVDVWANAGKRVLVLGSTQEKISANILPTQFSPAAFLVFEEQIREEAIETVKFFTQQGIGIKIISGDNPKTVSALAIRVGVPQAEKTIDAQKLTDDLAELGKSMAAYTVFGRVTPQQKRNMIQALKSSGHVVAMTGDGVNDVLALKEANMGIAMGNGAAATKAVAQVVLLDGKFSTLPLILAEGRKVIHNIERVAHIFLTKTVYIALIAVGVGMLAWPFPFLPRHLTLLDSLTIGIPGFFLALSPSVRRYTPGFVMRVLRFIIPVGGAAGVTTLITFGMTHTTTITLVVLMMFGFWVLSLMSRPFTISRFILLGSMVGLFGLVLLVPFARHFFNLELPPWNVFFEGITIGTMGIVSLELYIQIRNRFSPPVHEPLG